MGVTVTILPGNETDRDRLAAIDALARTADAADAEYTATLQGDLEEGDQDDACDRMLAAQEALIEEVRAAAKVGTFARIARHEALQ